MKKITSILVALSLFATTSLMAQQKPITKMDSTKSSITVQPQNYTYTNVYVLVNNISYNSVVSFGLPGEVAADSISINATATLYASKSSFDSGAQMLTSVQVNFKIPNTGTLPDHWLLKQKIYAKL